MDKDSKKLESLIDPSVRAIKRALTEHEMSADDAAKAKIATGVLSTYAKLKQSERAQEGNMISLAQLLTNDKEQLAAYIRQTMPDLPKLPTGKEK